MLGYLSILLLVPLLGSLLTYLGGYISNKFSKWFAIILSFILLVYSLYLALIYDMTVQGFQLIEEYYWAPAFGLSFKIGIDGISLIMIIPGTLLSFIAAASSPFNIHHHEKEYYALLLLFESAILGVFMSLNLVLFYVFWELVLIPMFPLIGIWGGPNRKYAALKFFIYTHVGSVIMLVGFISFYILSSPHTFDMIALANAGFPASVQLWLGLTILIGCSIKLPIFPFHTWLPDAHVQAPSPVSVLLAGLLLKMGGYGLIRLGLYLTPLGFEIMAPYLMILAIFSSIYAAFVALAQTDLKRLVAFTSINHMGFVMLGVSAMNIIGVMGAVFQMFSHGTIIALLFLLTGVVHHHVGTRVIDKLAGLKMKLPYTTALLAFGSIAAISTPGTSGFIAEATILRGALDVSLVSIFAILGMALTAGYFLWMLHRAPFNPTASNEVENGHEASGWELLPLALLVIPIILLGVYPEVILQYITSPIVNLLSGLGGA
ncbi:MAG: complex I subunit 4 family protein [Candidatus Asgardarchaeia archaeon]